MSPDLDSLHRYFANGPGEQTIRDLDLEHIPAHIAVIMDGNGRWAAARSLPRIAGHRAGAKALRETIETAIHLGVGCLTIYSFSSENWSRSAEEVSGLMGLFVEILGRELDNLQRMRVRVIVAGRKDDLPQATREAFERSEIATADNDGMTLVVALNYGGRAEIVDAVRAIAHLVDSGAMDADSITEETVANHLYTAGLPDPDLVIRTSGEMRISNFLLWQIAYSELWVTETLWPDFDRHELLAAILEFQGRTRRFGGRA